MDVCPWFRHTWALSLSHIHIHKDTLFLSHTHKHAHKHTNSLSYTLTHTNTFSLTHTSSHADFHTQTHTHAVSLIYVYIHTNNQSSQEEIISTSDPTVGKGRCQELQEQQDWFGPSEDGFVKTQQTENSALKMGINWWSMDVNTLYVSYMKSTTDPLLFCCLVANSCLTLWWPHGM